MKSTARYNPPAGQRGMKPALWSLAVMEHYLEWAVILQDDDGPDGAIFAIKQYVHFGKGIGEYVL